MRDVVVPLAQLKSPECSILLHYPSGDPAQALLRVREVAKLGVTHIVLGGPVRIGPFRVLGKGCVSIVVKALSRWGLVALKIRRADSDRPSMENEAKMQMAANSAGVGPKLYAYSENAIVMELIDGLRLKEWVLSSDFTTEALRTVIATSLLEARKLDSAGLDHGELSRADKHVIVTRDGRGRVIDFESASLSRRPRNVTSLASFFFMRKPLADAARHLVRRFEPAEFIARLRTYKAAMDDRVFNDLLEYLDLAGLTV